MKAIVQLILLFILIHPLALSAAEQAPPLPKESSKWLDGKALQWGDLKGKVVVINVWTFACWNSYRSLPWLVSVQKKYPDLRIVGVHSPEFDYEKDRTRMRETMKHYNVSFPQVLDDDHAYWNALGNRYWPAFYVVDGNGQIRGKFSGETHEGDTQARQIESLIGQLSSQ